MSNPNNKPCNNSTCNRKSSQNTTSVPPRRLSFAQDDYDSDDDDEYYIANESQTDPYLSFTGGTCPANTSSRHDMSSGYFNRSDIDDTSYRTADPYSSVPGGTCPANTSSRYDMSSGYFNRSDIDDTSYRTADPYSSFPGGTCPANTSSRHDMSSGYFNRSDIDATSYRTADPGTPNYRSGMNYPRGPSPVAYSTPRRQIQAEPDSFYYGAPPSPINRTVPECCRTLLGQDSSFLPVNQADESTFYQVNPEDVSACPAKSQNSTFYRVNRDDIPIYPARQAQDSSFVHVSQEDEFIPFSQQDGYDSSNPNMTSCYFNSSDSDTTDDMSSGYFDRNQSSRRYSDDSYEYFEDTRRGNDTTPYSFMDDAVDMSRADPTQQSLYSVRNKCKPVRDCVPTCQAPGSSSPTPFDSGPPSASSCKPVCASPCSANNKTISPPVRPNSVNDGEQGFSIDITLIPSTSPDESDSCPQNKTADHPEGESFIQIDSGDSKEPVVAVSSCRTRSECLKNDEKSSQEPSQDNVRKSTDKIKCQRSKCSQKSDCAKHKKSKIPQKSTKSCKQPRKDDKSSKKEEDEKLVQAKQDSINMLSVVISTVMLLAAEVSNIPENYSSWSVKYLKCIKNSQGQYPANVRKILTMLTSEEEMDDISKLEKNCKCPYTPRDKNVKNN